MDSLELYATAAYPNIEITQRSGAYTWNQLGTPDIGSYGWSGIALSEDGSRIVASVIGGSESYIYTSDDRGYSWTQRTSSGSRDWQVIACSADGIYIVAAVYGGYVYVSTDGGATWAEKTAMGSGAWQGVSVSASGLKMAAAAINGKVYVSSDGGNTWTEQVTLGTKYWYGVKVSADGTVIAAVESPGYIYFSYNGGTSWVTNTSAGSRNWRSIDFTPDRQKIIASVNNSNVYVSLDKGITWVATNSLADSSYTVFISSDGSVMLAGNSNDLWSSLDNGQSWNSQYGEITYPFAANRIGDNVAIVCAQAAGIKIGIETSAYFIPVFYELAIEYGGVLIDADITQEIIYQTDFITDLAWPELSGSITVGDSYSASLPVSESGVLLSATIDSATAVFEAAPVQFQATLLMGMAFELTATGATVSLSAALELPIAVGGSLVSAGVGMSASLLTGTILSFVSTAAAVSLSSSYLLGSLFSASIAPSGGIRLGSDNITTALEYGGSLVAAFPWLAVDLRLNGGGSVEVWLVNARTSGMAQYSNYPFMAFTIMGNGLVLAGAADGLYLMDSTTDAGEEITGVVEVGTTDMGASVVKYVTDAVLDCEGSGEIVLSAISDGGTIRDYGTSIDHHGLQQNKRVKLAKGIKSRYWSARLALPVGVSVASLELRPDATRRTS